MGINVNMMPNRERQIIGPDQSHIFDAGINFLLLRHQCENLKSKDAASLTLFPPICTLGKQCLKRPMVVNQVRPKSASSMLCRGPLQLWACLERNLRMLPCFLSVRGLSPPTHPHTRTRTHTHAHTHTRLTDTPLDPPLQPQS